ncbi:MAG: hypothetical protein Q9203_007135 [Teloschistes exilis]
MPDATTPNELNVGNLRRGLVKPTKSCKLHSAPESKSGLGRLWGKVLDGLKATVRVLSLNLIIHAFRGLRHPLGRGLHEPLKVAMRQNRLIAMLRTLIHVVPFGFSLFEIILNWEVYYVGTTPYSQTTSQIIAKAHEILIQASIAAIIFSALRRELALGNGLPFGTPNNGLDITQLLVTTQHAVVADALTDTGRLWFSSLPTVTGDIGHGSPKFDQSDATHTIHTNYSQPVALSACRPTHFTNANKTDHVRFPLLFGVNPPGLANSNDTEAGGFIRHPNLFYSQISQISDYGVDWIELPAGPFKDSSIGAVIKFPSTHPKVPSYQNVITCNIVAAWSPGSLALKMAAGSITEAVTNFENKSSPAANKLPFSYSKVPDAEEQVHSRNDVFTVDPRECQDWTTFLVDSTFQGYGYNAYTVPPRIAIAVMVLYCLFVVGHTIYSGTTGISSNCWDTIAEVTAIAVNSRPTSALRNTCAGISELHIFKLPVHILVSRDDEGEDEHLELIFGEVDKEKTRERRIKPNRTYGSFPPGGQRKKEIYMGGGEE